MSDESTESLNRFLGNVCFMNITEGRAYLPSLRTLN